MSKKKENPMSQQEIIKRMNEVRFKQMAENREKIIASGVRHCNKCDKDKPLSDFSENASYCKLCHSMLSKMYTKNHSEKITDRYCKDYARRHYGMTMNMDFPEELIKAIRDEIIAKRAAKEFLTFKGIKFNSIRSLSIYIEKNYGIGASTVEARIHKMQPDDLNMLIVDTITMRKFSKRATPIKAVNTVTKEVEEFLSINDAEKSLHIGRKTIGKSIMTGKPNQVYNNSVNFNTYNFYKNGNKIESNRTIGRLKTSQVGVENCAI